MNAYSITAAMVAFISSLNIGDGCSTQVPYTRPGRFQTLENIGGEIESKVCHTTMAIQCWALDESTAEADSNTVALAIETSMPPEGVHSMHVSQTGYPWFDDSTRCPRYQLVCEITHQLTD